MLQNMIGFTFKTFCVWQLSMFLTNNSYFHQKAFGAILSISWNFKTSILLHFQCCSVFSWRCVEKHTCLSDLQKKHFTFPGPWFVPTAVWTPVLPNSDKHLCRIGTLQKKCSCCNESNIPVQARMAFAFDFWIWWKVKNSPLGSRSSRNNKFAI